MFINHDDVENVEKSETLKEFPEKIVFSIKDLKEMYENFALKDERIKEFIERINEFVVA